MSDIKNYRQNTDYHPNITFALVNWEDSDFDATYSQNYSVRVI